MLTTVSSYSYVFCIQVLQYLPVPMDIQYSPALATVQFPL